MAFIAAFMLWKLADNNRQKEASGKQTIFNTHNALQIVFFFMIVASLIIVGRAGLDSGQKCEFLIMNETVSNNITIFEHAYTCEDVSNVNNLWIFKLPLWLAYISGLYVLIYFLIMIGDYILELFNKGGKRG